MHELLFEEKSLELLEQALLKLDSGFRNLPDLPTQLKNLARFEEVLMQTAERLTDNYPYFHPLYAGQMLKPPHPVARTAYMLAMWLNPNNHALDGGKASSHMEKEAVAHIAAMFGWNRHLGHLTSGGTMANLEALWIAGQLHPGKKIVASAQAHYTHARISKVLGLPFSPIDTDNRGKIDLKKLESGLKNDDIGTVVATLGTTAIGAVDPLDQLLELQEKYHFRIHADCAYGGYFTLAENLTGESRAAFDGLAQVDSIVVDPHKHGLQPFGCGCVLFRDPAVGKFYQHESPYTYFSSDELHLGEISLECSRPGAAAVALWATQQLLPSIRHGEFSASLEQCREAAKELYQRLSQDDRFIIPAPPELDIVFCAPKAMSTTKASALSQKIFAAAEANNLYLALADIPVDFFDLSSDMMKDSDTIKCLRSTLMKSEHFDWLNQIWIIIEKATTQVLLLS
jgi:glutamate/tyrosine decarboxylase-like PLP-dependent enzyme